jgi:hypothetical protein
MHFHGEILKNGGQNRIKGESESTSKEIPENDDFSCFGSGNLFTRGGTCITDKKKPGFLVFFDKFSCNLRFAEHKSRGIRFYISQVDKFAWISVDVGKILFAPDLFSDLISPSSRLLES